MTKKNIFNTIFLGTITLALILILFIVLNNKTTNNEVQNKGALVGGGVNLTEIRRDVILNADNIKQENKDITQENQDALVMTGVNLMDVETPDIVKVSTNKNDIKVENMDKNKDALVGAGSNNVDFTQEQLENILEDINSNDNSGKMAEIELTDDQLVDLEEK